MTKTPEGGCLFYRADTDKTLDNTVYLCGGVMSVYSQTVIQLYILYSLYSHTFVQKQGKGCPKNKQDFVQRSYEKTSKYLCYIMGGRHNKFKGFLITKLSKSWKYWLLFEHPLQKFASQV